MRNKITVKWQEEVMNVQKRSNYESVFTIYEIRMV